MKDIEIASLLSFLQKENALKNIYSLSDIG
ncbi:unknown protein [Parachlamydia acanthamoebae UV-7]|uniref:Uncharacterized protein n=1 Tax=Parachlamydia acanthamoebae (strain UV7) TaxID=765952 RepID=F8L1M2_PARAV|nr:unknown protein [Parachlamydia acanthamoebae UV-7]